MALDVDSTGAPFGRTPELPENPAFASGDLPQSDPPPTKAGESPSAWERFFDVFFQEQNIQWILGVGILILLGSSLMLVTNHWHTYTPVWKHLILLAYTAGLHFAGQLAYHTLGLRKTGTGLMVLTVLLLPLGFLAMRWIHPEDALSIAGGARHLGLLVLLAVNAVFAALASARIFRHFLRSTQPTFLTAYLALCVAGAAVPLIPAVLAPVATAILWFVFAAGAVKVNRHVFWMAEEHRLPRIVGFFPILLLGGQFLGLFAAGLAPHITLAWVGFGLVLTAIPVFLTADALARVFLEVHGSVKRPLPWSIIAPMFIGLTMTLAGVILAGLRFPQAGVLVPTAALAAGVMAVVARRTGKQAFVWAMLAGVVMAYQCSPVFFREFALAVVRSGAAAVSESRLPLAFYGLTYLPLVLAISGLAVFLRRRGDTLFAPVLRRFALFAPAILLAVAFTHDKALFPVGLALMTLCGVQGILFRSRGHVWLGVASLLTATFGFVPFATTVLGWSIGGPALTLLQLATWTTAAVLLRWPGAAVDRLSSAWLPEERRDFAPSICRIASVLVTLGCVSSWFMVALFEPVSFTAMGILAVACAVLLASHALYWPSVGLGDLFFTFLAGASTLALFHARFGLAAVATFQSLAFAALWLIAPALAARGNRWSDSFAGPSRRVSTGGMLLLIGVLLIPLWGLSLVFANRFEMPIAALVATAWLFDAARRWESGRYAVAAWLAMLATSGSLLITWAGPMTQEWLPTLWGTLALVAIPLLRRSQHEGHSPVEGAPSELPSESYWISPLRGCVLTTLGVVALGSLVLFTTPLRVAGGVALLGLLMLAFLWRLPVMRRLALIVVNWQVLCAVIQLFLPHARTLADLAMPAFLDVAFPLALVAAFQAILWQRSLKKAGDEHELIVVQSVALQAVSILSLICAVERRAVPLSLAEVAMIVATFGLLIADRIASALRLSAVAAQRTATPTDGSPSLRLQESNGEVHVWGAEILLLLGIGYLALFDVIHFGHGLSMYLVLAAGLVSWGLALWAEGSPSTKVLARPLSMTGFVLPAVTVCLGLGRHLMGVDSIWLGMNSLALLMAGAFYFWQGIERHQKSLIVASAAVLNVALALLWHELHWFDPQFFLIPLGVSVLGLVELLHDEIPEKAHDPLRYAGSLIILVSPTFHIVDGSWLHLISLMVASVAVTLTAMGLRIRALMYAGTAFLVADVIAMVVCGSIDEPSVLWIAGIGLGTALIGLAAYCERHREQMLQRLRMIAAELESWR